MSNTMAMDRRHMFLLKVAFGENCFLNKGGEYFKLKNSMIKYAALCHILLKINVWETTPRNR